MSMRTLAAVLILLALGIFVAANWAAFTTPTVLSLVVATIEAPLGIVMLGITAAVAAIFLAYAFYVQASASRESNRLTQAIERQRELADRAEASRFTELNTSIGARLDGMAATLGTLQQVVGALDAKLDRIDTTAPRDTPPSAASTPALMRTHVR
jgi:uncharacterized integral membrane protein